MNDKDLESSGSSPPKKNITIDGEPLLFFSKDVYFIRISQASLVCLKSPLYGDEGEPEWVGSG